MPARWWRGAGWKVAVLCLLQVAWLSCTCRAVLISGTTVTFQASDRAGNYTGTINSYLSGTNYNKYVFESSGTNPWVVGPLTIAHDNTEIVLSASTTLKAMSGTYGLRDCLITARGLTNVTISGTTGSTLVMNPDEYAASGTSEARHAISVWSCTTVRIDGLTIQKTGGDGIYIGDNSGAADNGKSSDVTVNNVVTDCAARNGLSVTSVDGLTISNCTFKNTQGTGNLASEGPWAGIDMEPNGIGEQLTRISIDHCAFLGNGNYGIVLAATRLSGTTAIVQGMNGGLDITVSNSLMQGNKLNGIKIANVPFAPPSTSSEITIRDCTIMDHPRPGILVQNKDETTMLLVKNCYLKNNSFKNFTYDAPIAVLDLEDANFDLHMYYGGSVSLNNVVVEQTLDRTVKQCLLAQSTWVQHPIDTVSGTYFYASSGIVTGTNVSSGTGSLPVTTVSPVSNAPASYWRLDESGTLAVPVIDSTGSSPGVIHGGPANYSSGRVGGAYQMSGTNGFAEITTSSTNLNVGVCDFSVALWFQRSGTAAATTSYLLNKGAFTSTDPGYALVGSNTNVTFLLGSGSTCLSVSAPIPALDQWNHVACTISRTGMMTLYLNGLFASQTDVSGWSATDIKNVQNLFIGSCYGHADLTWAGMIDDVQVYNRALLASEVLEMSQKAASYWPFSYITGGVDAHDKVGRCNGTIQGSGTGTAGIAGGALSLSGTNQDMELGTNEADIDIGKSDFTFTCWFQRTSSTTGNARLFYKGATSSTDPGYAIVGSDNSVTFMLCDGATRLTVEKTIPGVNQWIHLACTVDRNGLATIYLNGKYGAQVNVSAMAGKDIKCLQNGLMGKCFGSSPYYWPGVIDDVRIYKRALSGLEVEKVYMGYSPTVLK